MKGELHQVGLWLIGALVVLGALYYFLVYRFSHKENPKSL